MPEGVTAYLSNLQINGNAFGVFAANTTSLELNDSEITNSLIDGVVFHRQVERSTVTGTSSNDNAGDGFRISRGSDAITLQDVTATGNGRNGVTINAGPLATGPSAVGLSTKIYGNHTVRDAVLTGNAASGITVIGGDGITLSRNRIESSPFGIVVQEGTTNLRIEDSTFSDIAKQSIALRDGIAGTVTQNVMHGGAVGIYVRDSSAQVDHNTIAGVNGHGISVVGIGGRNGHRGEHHLRRRHVTDRYRALAARGGEEHELRGRLAVPVVYGGRRRQRQATAHAHVGAACAAADVHGDLWLTAAQARFRFAVPRPHPAPYVLARPRGSVDRAGRGGTARHAESDRVDADAGSQRRAARGGHAASQAPAASR